jgi:hypothetical protein
VGLSFVSFFAPKKEKFFFFSLMLLGLFVNFFFRHSFIEIVIFSWIGNRAMVYFAMGCDGLAPD